MSPLGEDPGGNGSQPFLISFFFVFMILKENRLWSLKVYKTNEIIIFVDPGPENFVGLGSKNNALRPMCSSRFYL